MSDLICFLWVVGMMYSIGSLANDNVKARQSRLQEAPTFFETAIGYLALIILWPVYLGMRE